MSSSNVMKVLKFRDLGSITTLIGSKTESRLDFFLQWSF